MSLIKFLIFLIFFVNNLIAESYNFSPEIYSKGFGAITEINYPEAIFLNPSRIAEAKFDYFSFSIIKPLKFYQLSILFFPKIDLNNFGLGIGILQKDSFISYEFSSGIKINNYFYSGINLAIYRAIFNDEKIGFGFSPSLQFNLKEFESYSQFEFKSAFYLKNILRKEIENYKDFTKLTIQYGFSFKLYLSEITYYLGGDYNSSLFNFGIGVKILQNFVLNLGFEKNYILTGFKISDEFSSLDCGFKYNFNNKNYDYIISYVKSIGEINKEVSAQKEIQIKEREKVSEKVLEKQKELIEEGLLYYRQNDYKKAKEIWENAYKLAPDSKYGREAKKYIERVNKILKQIGE